MHNCHTHPSSTTISHLWNTITMPYHLLPTGPKTLRPPGSQKDSMSTIGWWEEAPMHHEIVHQAHILVILGQRASVGPCSQMLYIKNKVTQLLMIRDLRPLKHYLPWDIMIFRRRS
jgi:hypothetical protein